MNADDIEVRIIFGKYLREGDVMYDGNADKFRTIARIEPGYLGNDHGYLHIVFTDGGEFTAHKGASIEIPAH